MTVMPWTPMPSSASRTSSSLNGLMIAMTNFMALSRFGGNSRAYHIGSGADN